MDRTSLRVLRRNLLAALTLSLASSSGTAAAATVTVCPVGCDSTSIQGAAVAANPGDTVQILSSQPHTESDIYLTKDLTITGFGISNTVIQAHATAGSALESVFVIVSGAKVTLQSLTVRYGGGSDGGGIRVMDGRLILDEVLIRENGVSNRGGGIFVGAGSSLQITGSFFDSNTAREGGGIQVDGSAKIVDTTLVDNTASATGGGVYNEGTLVLESSQVLQNKAKHDLDEVKAGGVYHHGSSLRIEDCNFTSNRIDSPGGGDAGGLYLDAPGPVDISRSTFFNNQASSGYGGGVYIHSGNVVLEDCVVTSNTGHYGGGVFAYLQASGALRIAHSAVTDNTAFSGGGILATGPGPAQLVNSTVSGNVATGDSGGIYVGGSGFEIASSTIANNAADADHDGWGDGGGIFVIATETVGMRNTIVADNVDGSTYPPNPVAPDCVGTIQSAGYNLVEDRGHPLPACGFDGNTTGNLIDVDPMLLPLADNGGSTETHALAGGSPAENAGNPAGCTDPDGLLLPVDQRHFLREDRCDMGSYEASATAHVIFMDGFETGTSGAWSSTVSG